MRFAVILAVILLGAGAALFATLSSFNYFAHIDRAFAGACTPVTGIAGPEDIRLDVGRRRAFISSLDRRADGARGAIHLFNLDDPLDAGGWRDITNGAPEAFRPLGMDYYEDEGVRRLFVANEANNSVEMFDVGEDGDLVHLESFTERRLTSPNSVVAVGRRSFYVTNDVRPGRTTLLGSAHFLTRAASGEILFTDGKVWRIAADGIRFANGLALSGDGERLYVAETAGEAVRIFRRNLETNALTPDGAVRLDAAPDNITIDESGAVWISALPQPLAAPRHGANAARLAPSEIIRLGPDGAPETIYRDDGTEISAAAGVARFGPQLLIGALFDDRLLICDLPDDAT